MKQWRVAIGQQQYGPISEEELKSWAAQGRVGPSDLVWSEGMSAWAPAGSVPELGLSPVGAMGATPPPFPPPTVQQQPHRGGAILTLGILGLVVCVICGIIAWVMGSNDLRQMDAGTMNPAGRGMTYAGKICGMISVILSLVGIVLAILINIIAAAATTHSFR